MLLKELIEIPERVHKDDFVLKLTEGVKRSEETLAQYVVTPELVGKFDQALEFIQSAVEKNSSKAAYLHGSFGSGKSHFMAVLYLLLQHDPDARSVSELSSVVSDHDEWLEGKSFLLVPYHLIGSKNLESAILGGYVDHLRKIHPETDPPAVFLSGKVLENAESLRESMGDDAFFDLLNKNLGGEEGGWGELEAKWDPESYDAAREAPSDHPDRRRLVSHLITNLFPALPGMAGDTGEGFVDLDEGLSALSQHAESLGYDALILFLDELILWLASHAGDIDFLEEEGQKLAKLVETSKPDRPVPLVSFVARQRDLRDLVGDHVPGAEKLSFAHVLGWWESRFDTITLEDRNLPAIIDKRVLVEKDDEARVALDQAFRETEKTRDEIVEILKGKTADRESFRRVYPFSPALVDTLVALSALLQRERTALKLLLQLLVDQRDTLELGDLVPVGDLWDVLQAGDEPFSETMRRHFDAARKLYREKLEPLLRSRHQLGPGEEPTEAFRNDARLAKTLLLAALAPEAEPLKAMDARRLAALNHGTIRSPIPGQEQREVLQKVGGWVSAGVGEIQLGEGNNPTIQVQLTGVDVEGILARAENEDNQGNRRRKIKERLFEALGIDDPEEMFVEHSIVWRGTRRRFDLLFANVRELPDKSLENDGQWWKVILDYPFDPGGGPRDDIARIQEFQGRQESARTLCWLPSFFSAKIQEQLGRFVRIDHVLTGERFDQFAGHLSAVDQSSARAILENERTQLERELQAHLEAAFGVRSGRGEALDSAHQLEGKEHFQSLTPGFDPQPPAAANLRDALEKLVTKALDHQFPGHPKFLKDEIRRTDIRKVFEELERATEVEGGRIRIENKQRRELLRMIAEPLELGQMHEAHFVLGDEWRNRFERKSAGADEEMSVGLLREAIDEPEARGLPTDLEDLVILIFAAQTNRSFTLHGGPAHVSFGDTLKDELVLKPEPLPSEEDWDRALELASTLLGVAPVSRHLTANNVGEAASRIRERIEELRSPAQALVSELAMRVRELGLDDPARLRTAREAATLITELSETETAEELVTALGSRKLETDPERVARSLAHAGEVQEALSRARWDIFGAAWKMTGKGEEQARKNREDVEELLARDELAVALAPRLQELDEEATRILGSVTKPTKKETEKPPRRPGAVIVDEGRQQNLDAEAARKLFTKLGKLLDEGDQRTLFVQWQIQEPGKEGEE